MKEQRYFAFLETVISLALAILAAVALRVAMDVVQGIGG